MEIITLAYATTCAGCGQVIPGGSPARSYPGGKIYHTLEEEKRITAGKAAPAPRDLQGPGYLELALLAYIEQQQLALANLMERIKMRR